jgi:wyosine [tRNA(Phe)-imidazoG37] synthetase (radical SAM superfamily)
MEENSDKKIKFCAQRTRIYVNTVHLCNTSRYSRSSSGAWLHQNIRTVARTLTDEITLELRRILRISHRKSMNRIESKQTNFTTTLAVATVHIGKSTESIS